MDKALRSRVRPLSEGSSRLLGAALHQDEQAISCWQEWWAQAGSLDGLDAGEYRLIPLVYRNLKTLGYGEAAEMGRLHGIYRQTWLRNRIAEARLLEAVESLESVGVESLALKGMALVGIAYGESGVRPMSDVDLLVHGKDLRRAVAELNARGWTFSQGRAGEELRFARLFHAVAFSHPSGVELDLHRHILEESNWRGADDGVWERKQQLVLSDRKLWTMSPTDHLVHLVVHGVRWDPVPPIRWIADAVTLIRTNEIDWDVVATEAEQRGVALAVGAALRFLRDEFAVQVPHGQLSKVESVAPGRLERIDFRFQQGGAGAVSQISRYVTRYLRLTSRRSALERVRLFPLYLRAMWGLESAWAIPKDGLRRTWIRARGGDPGRERSPT